MRPDVAIVDVAGEGQCRGLAHAPAKIDEAGAIVGLVWRGVNARVVPGEQPLILQSVAGQRGVGE
jgi:hypothetical protein